ncbi:hypothetical protein [Kineosporia sp. A_224]|uniref:hypothetical protein n=1 Tax=Kineosporia sp. A_224 TaxID=1962180 RepID=UPI0018E99C02|nr:hypothetical protein [Kineosporia sp. A_224]
MRLAGLGVLAAALSAAAAVLGSGTVTTVTGEDDTAPRREGPSSGGPGDAPGASTAPGPVTLGEGRATAPRGTSARPSRSASPGPSRTPSARPRGDGPAGGTRLEGVYVTAYSWFDNTPRGSSTVSHPVLHRTAGGTGTYADPVTVAVGHDRSTGRDVLDHPAGTRFYLPHLRRYVIVEDTCGDGPAPQDGPCHDLSQAPPGTTLWLDVWIGGAEGTETGAQACAARLTGDGGRTAVLDPPPGLPVLAGPVYSTRCALP